MLINTPISLGELVDKISILIIKQKNITDETKLDHVKKELDFLQKTLMNYVQQEEINNYLENLININSKLWNIEDDIRECERKKLFDQTFIDLARSVYFTNDERAKVKNDINKTFGSELVEVKSYEEY
ncbi:MAG: hypothetical protein CM15mP24_4070 [Candidatus Pelagibacterales bacterium]|jgi:hypothetical protein|nr:MAG: hypothetical protein CM15mP24_4070 [Pelagibacterales bacterium]|tara:strand:+ start:212 stop:595 length:384 start_codon:yes stop_codon:yes gene_type:complete